MLIWIRGVDSEFDAWKLGMSSDDQPEGLEIRSWIAESSKSFFTPFDENFEQMFEDSKKTFVREPMRKVFGIFHLSQA